MLRVAKFGGTSMGTAESITAVAEIIEQMAGEKAVVVSATSGTTDKLIEMGALALNENGWEKLLEELEEKHQSICEDLKIEIDLSECWESLKKLVHGISLLGELSIQSKDRLQTFGERISSKILATYLKSRNNKSEAFDAFDLIFTDDNYGAGNVDFEKTDKVIKEKLLTLIESGVIPVITGFVAQSLSGEYITLGRGGSDYTGAIIASALSADELQIWTDVDGIYQADPRLVKEAKVLESLSFAEAGELAYFGAKVLHPKTIKPALAANIPVRILNTFNPGAVGTVIKNEEEESIKSVTYKKGVSVINICSAGMLEARGFLARLFEVFAKNEISVDVVATSEVSVSLTVNCEVEEDLIKDLEEFASVEIFEKMAIICLVGGELKSNKKVLGRLFGAVGDHDIQMVSEGASKRNITFVVPEDQAQDVVKKVFNEFF
jgi:aspartate kinase